MSVYVWMCIGTRQIFPKWPLLCAKSWPKWVPTWTPGSQKFASPMSKLIATSIRRTKYSDHCTKACLILLFLTSFNFTYFFSYFISNFRLHPPKLTGLIQFWDWIVLGPQDPKLFWGRLGPQGPKCYFGVRGWFRFWVGQGPKLGRVTGWVGLSHRLNPKIHLRNQNEPKFWGRYKLGLQDPNLGQVWPLGSNIKYTLRRHIHSCF